jgi:hypothetical protein
VGLGACKGRGSEVAECCVMIVEEDGCGRKKGNGGFQKASKRRCQALPTSGCCLRPFTKIQSFMDADVIQ